jgi:tetratricopeptide (TPR) repeat protein
VKSEALRAAMVAAQRDEWGTSWKFANVHLNDEPDSAEGLFLAGKALRDMGHVGLATTVFRRALAIDASRPILWMQYGSCFHDMHDHDNARKAFEIVAKALPDDPMPPANIASGYVMQGRPLKGLEWAERALKLDPDIRIGQVAHSFCNLGLGRWAEGWKYADKVYGHQVPWRTYCDPEEPIWDGTKGQTVVVQCDQGLGDQIMFAQCLPQLIADSKLVVIECSKRMAGLFGRLAPGAVIKTTLKDATLEWPKEYAIDAHVHISLLGRWYRTKNSDFPRKPYLLPDAERVAKWKAWLEQHPKPWVGIAWRGGIPQTMTHTRSLELSEMAPLLEQDGTLVDMSYQNTNAEVAAWNLEHEQQIIRPPIDETDYDDTVALAVALDDIVTVTTTLAHVCGALGRHAYVLVPAGPQWRYQYGAGDGLWWYPEGSVELFRQVRGEVGWAHTVGRLAKAREKINRLRRLAA